MVRPLLLLTLTSIAVGAEVDVNGHRVWYEASGSGRPTIVLVHGWSCDLSFWRLQRPALEKQYRVIAVDLPGHGRSEKPKVDYTLETFSRGVRRVLDQEKIERAVLVGHSMGTGVVRRVLADEPDRVVALVSVDGAVMPTVPPGVQKWVADFASLLRGDEHDAAATRMIDNMFRASTPLALREEIRSKMLRAPAHVAASAMEHSIAREFWSTLPPAAVPVLAINAKSERPGRKADHEQVFSKLEYHELEGVSHFLMMEKPDEVNRLIVDFVSRLR